MTYNAYSDGKIKLEAGSSHPFRVHSVTRLQDGEDYFILGDPNGLKHFLYAKPYANYGIVEGSTITCRIDKINCTGRIYLEPEHPVYRTGEEYEFLICGKVSGQSQTSIFLHDCFGNKIKLDMDSQDIILTGTSKTATCSILSKKKGQPRLQLISII